jgi:hypothetical protein
MKKLIVITTLLILICVSGCFSTKPTLQIGGNEELQKKIKELQEKLSQSNDEVKITKEQMEQLKNDTLDFMNLKGSVNSFSFRVWSTIKTVAKFILKVMWAMVSTWVGDLLWLAGLIMVFTWAFSFISKFLSLITGIWGMVIKVLTFWMSFSGNLKIITTIIWALILSMIWRWTHSPCDWSYILPIGAMACILANVCYEYLVNKTGASDKAEILTHKVLAEKLKAKGIEV